MIDKAIQELVARGVKKNSYYQKIWHADRDLENEPPISLGILDDDIIALKKMIKEDIPTAYDFERFGALLTIIGAILDRG